MRMVRRWAVTIGVGEVQPSGLWRQSDLSRGHSRGEEDQRRWDLRREGGVGKAAVNSGGGELGGT